MFRVRWESNPFYLPVRSPLRTLKQVKVQPMPPNAKQAHRRSENGFKNGLEACTAWLFRSVGCGRTSTIKLQFGGSIPNCPKGANWCLVLNFRTRTLQTYWKPRVRIVCRPYLTIATLLSHFWSRFKKNSKRLENGLRQMRCRSHFLVWYPLSV